ncbi:hypothetical protein LCGC14_1809740 [marine sediment metagenome]|uniref:Uncharacterized protein n=1 Tax=marine sediment metagenome TaxID=412755 RepID=A0A0F9HA87_9ZZZZ
MVNEKTIWCSKQNHPELVIKDCIREFNLNSKQAEKLRFILMNRGINKWLLARRRFITLKHKVKDIMKESISQYGHKHPLVKHIKKIQAEMQNIAKLPRWIEWGVHIHRKMKANEGEIVIKGKHC